VRTPPVRRRLAAAIAIVAAAATTSGCTNPFGERLCTLIGCSSGLGVELAAPVPAGSVVEVTADTGETRSVECGTDQLCEFGVFFDDFTPSHVTVRVQTPTGTTTVEFDPHYEKYQPNGGGCGPICLQAHVEVEVPAVPPTTVTPTT